MENCMKITIIRLPRFLFARTKRQSPHCCPPHPARGHAGSMCLPGFQGLSQRCCENQVPSFRGSTSHCCSRPTVVCHPWVAPSSDSPCIEE
eukprot:2405256-Amphidinium_carterae.1